jgi:hypothetical protein
MTDRRYCVLLVLIVLGVSIQPRCFAQDSDKDKPKKQPPKITKVTIFDQNGQKITRLEIDLQNAPNNMEPVAEPRQIRIDDRANVQFLLKNLSPLDVCSRTASTPTPTPETNVAESLVTSIAALGGLAIGGTTSNLPANSSRSMALANQNQAQLAPLLSELQLPPTPQCKVQDDPEYKQILASSKDFFPGASGLIGLATPDGRCRNDQADQVELACEIDSATRKLADYAGADYRGTLQARFVVDGNPELQPVRDSYTLPLRSIRDTGKLQSMVDEMSTWALDLHKKYDYKVPPDVSPQTPPPPVPGVLTVSPTALNFTPANLTQVVQLSSGGQPGTFTATPASDTGWLLLSKAGTTPPTTGTVRDTAPTRGTFDLLVIVNPAGLDTTTHYGSITISGIGLAKGTTIVNVTFKSVVTPTQLSQCDLDHLREVDGIVDRAKAEMSLISDNNKALEAAQGTLKANYMALVTVEDRFKSRTNQRKVYVTKGILVQEFNLPTDRKDTSPGYISCVSDINGTTPTTTNINYTLLYQDVPHWSASAGLVVSTQEKNIIGIANENTPGSSPPVNTQVFAITDRARIQLIPMVYANYRILPYKSTHYGKGKEDELVWTAHLSGGFGINPNTGTAQPEFFVGFAIGLNRFMFHPGVDFGRTQSLGGGYLLNTPVPAGVTTAPISWSYHPAFSIGFSVRVAPW